MAAAAGGVRRAGGVGARGLNGRGSGGAGVGGRRRRNVGLFVWAPGVVERAWMGVRGGRGTALARWDRERGAARKAEGGKADAVGGRACALAGRRALRGKGQGGGSAMLLAPLGLRSRAWRLPALRDRCLLHVVLQAICATL